MKILYTDLKVTYPSHKLNGSKTDLLVEKGKIVQIGKVSKQFADKVVSGKHLLLIPALVDLQCSVGEPGHEYKETLESLSKCAKSGGYDTLVILPTTSPVIDNKAQLEYIERRSSKYNVDIRAYGAVTKGAKGTDLSEMFDMHAHGAVAFSDGKHAIEDVNMMKRALEYAKNFDGLICSFPFDGRLNPGGMVHESEFNTTLGLKSTPSLAEEMMLNRDLDLLEYTNSRLHVSTISTAGSVKLIKEAKRKKLKVTAGVALANLVFKDENLKNFDTNFKTLPVLRESSDLKALVNGLKNGDIDVIVSDHTPENIENKDREFDHADYGMTMLETALSLASMKLSSTLGWDRLVNAMSLKPREILGLKAPLLEKGESFNFIVFDPDMEWTYDKNSCQSLSHNSPMFGQKLKGKVVS